MTQNSTLPNVSLCFAEFWYHLAPFINPFIEPMVEDARCLPEWDTAFCLAMRLWLPLIACCEVIAGNMLRSGWPEPYIHTVYVYMYTIYDRLYIHHV